MNDNMIFRTGSCFNDLNEHEGYFESVCHIQELDCAPFSYIVIDEEMLDGWSFGVTANRCNIIPKPPTYVNFYEAAKMARMARFEFGETPKIIRK